MVDSSLDQLTSQVVDLLQRVAQLEYEASIAPNQGINQQTMGWEGAKLVVSEIDIVGPTGLGATIIADVNGDVIADFGPGSTISGATISAGTINASALNTLDIVVTGMTLTDNSPGAGSVAWSACIVYYGGVAYPISAGNTSNQFIYWTVGGSTFTGAASFTPGPTIFLVATNVSGISDTAWNKVAKGSIQEDNLSFGLLSGLAIQDPVTATLDRSNASATVTQISVSGAGGLLSIGLVNTSAPGPGSGVSIKYSVDGATERSITVYADLSSVHHTTARAVATNTVGDGSANGDLVSFYLGIGFSSSLVVKTAVVGSGGSGTIAFAATYALAT